jgi:hypothetical protein
MAKVTIQDYANILSHPHTLFFDGHCFVAHHQPRIRLALTARKTGALAVLLLADQTRDKWLMVSGLKADARADKIILAGTTGLVLELSFTDMAATGSLQVLVSNKRRTRKRRVRFAVTLKKLRGSPGPPSVGLGRSWLKF